VHAEETEVMSGAQAGDDEVLFGFGGGRLFDDMIDRIETLAMRDAFAADGAVVGKHVLARGLHCGNGTGFGSGDFDELLRAAASFAADVEMVADEVKERFFADEIARAKEGVAVTERFDLFDEMKFAGEIAGGGAIGGLVAGANDEANFIHARAEGFLDNDPESGFLDSIPIHERLQRQRVLIASGRGEYAPIAPNDTPENKQKNRRIEIMLLDKALVEAVSAPAAK